jgi:ribosome-binding protein aMBF1 (putative translation factor)
MGWSQSDLVAKSGISGVMIGKHKREEAVPSIEKCRMIIYSFFKLFNALSKAAMRSS